MSTDKLKSLVEEVVSERKPELGQAHNHDVVNVIDQRMKEDYGLNALGSDEHTRKLIGLEIDQLFDSI